MSENDARASSAATDPTAFYRRAHARVPSIGLRTIRNCNLLAVQQTAPTAAGLSDDFRAIRFHVTAELAGRIFDQFVVDVGFLDSTTTTPDTIQTSDMLSFAHIDPVRAPALPLPQHVAEKVHAYTRTYGETARPSTRPKDLVDQSHRLFELL